MKTLKGPSGEVPRTAVLIVAGEDSAPDRAYETIRSRFGAYFDQIVFITVGLLDHEALDAPDFKSGEVGERVKQEAKGAIRSCVDRAREAGMEAITCVAIGTDPADEIERLCAEFAARCPQAMFFLGKVVFRNRRWYHGLLHASTADSVQRRLEQRGLPLVILPFVISA
jgi:hypothetical protein